MRHKNTHGAIIDAVSNGSFSMLFNSDCLFFGGHFPDNPVVPGVLLLDTIYDNLLKTGMSNIAGIDNARFYKTVLPNEKVIVKINDQPDKVVCTVKNDTGKVLKVSYIKVQ
ncbi:hypothetical protein [Serratia proteamaculans]|uniref:hypothetical protein n=1 Tax=Serratia proteamaculans TaxID=28151 RepID=UPI002178420D|nr:hypothetical protein [Serratia proteamaculans]CAI1825849.1 (3R)-hydroxymyristoyl-[acyl-carrier-protein] dehydratase [Serratia proteamaculans]CAI2409721.1 (3R)-hydroxymyristoyl-[acyl-carrier-protein] dehydratase [Serratia proteamaculans]CAI2488363.1 (3R)-hydroxymyristoyl-[acyl-carrier-protein] dehydratase [Serratia proteamaculans]